MALTERKRKFAEALLRGERKTDAARQAGYSAATASQMANKLGKDADILRYMDAKRGVAEGRTKRGQTFHTGRVSALQEVMEYVRGAEK